MTLIYVDTEFNGFGGELISMALVSDTGLEWYEVLPLPETIEPWVQANVIPVLGQPSISRDDFRDSLHGWLTQFHRPCIVADWYTDLVHFFNQFAGKDHAESIIYPCTAELVSCDYVSAIPHNALSDARAIRDALRIAA